MAQTTPQVKICGITGPDALQAAVQGRARFAGFVFYPPSVRALDLESARSLTAQVPTGMRAVGLLVDPEDDMLGDHIRMLHLDMIQLHGNESPGRAAEIRARFGIPVMKALKIADESDLDHLPGYESACDWLLFDAATNPGDVPGGTGQSFNWTLLQDRDIALPGMLAGGLYEDNIAQALEV